MFHHQTGFAVNEIKSASVKSTSEAGFYRLQVQVWAEGMRCFLSFPSLCSENYSNTQ